MFVREFYMRILTCFDLQLGLQYIPWDTAMYWSLQGAYKHLKIPNQTGAVLFLIHI
uniref:Uncharacterized protein n=1 Tax=Anguilla anguilla TaxID=7936 RepID=A0A0E9QLZ3_ANGAN